MRELRPIVKCDRCKTEEVPADTVSSIVDVIVPGGVSIRFSGENCDACAAQLEVQLTALLAEYLVKEEPKRARTRRSYGTVNSDEPEADRTCPLCVLPKFDPYVGPTRTALGQHLSTKHGKTLTDVGMNKIAAPTPRKPRTPA